MNTTADFLKQVYRALLVQALIGSLIAWPAVAWQAALSFAAGVLMIGLVVFFWELTLRHTLKPRAASVWRETAMVFLRYILLGGLIYAMIALFAVRWAWFCAGIATLVPGLLFASFWLDRKPRASKPER